MYRPPWYKRAIYHALWWLGGFLENLPVILRHLGQRALRRNWLARP